MAIHVGNLEKELILSKGEEVRWVWKEKDILQVYDVKTNIDSDRRPKGSKDQEPSAWMQFYWHEQNVFQSIEWKISPERRNQEFSSSFFHFFTFSINSSRTEHNFKAKGIRSDKNEVNLVQYEETDKIIIEEFPMTTSERLVSFENTHSIDAPVYQKSFYSEILKLSA
jgi:hypothetical protein